MNIDEKSNAIEDEREIRVLKNWLVHKLRRISYMWFHRKAAMSKARISRGKYKCAMCGGIFGPKEINVDHILPVVPVTGWDNWDGFINRLFCKEEGYQIICKPDHDKKTQNENEGRAEHNPNYRTFNRKSKSKTSKVAKGGRKTKRKVKK